MVHPPPSHFWDYIIWLINLSENVNENWRYFIQCCLHQLMDDNLVICATTFLFFATIKNIFCQLYKATYTTHGIITNINWNITNLIYLSMGLRFAIPWVFLVIFYGSSLLSSAWKKINISNMFIEYMNAMGLAIVLITILNIFLNITINVPMPSMKKIQNFCIVFI